MKSSYFAHAMYAKIMGMWEARHAHWRRPKNTLG